MEKLSDKALINNVYKVARKLASQGKWLACDIVAMRCLLNKGLHFTELQSAGIKRTKEKCIVYPMGDDQMHIAEFHVNVLLA